jgi:hypothetical protein
VGDHLLDRFGAKAAQFPMEHSDAAVRVQA